jgi:hypothetical protein
MPRALKKIFQSTYSNKLQKKWGMPRNETELLKRDAKRNIGEERLTAIRDVKSGRHGIN